MKKTTYKHTNFVYEPHDMRAEDKRIKDFRIQFDPDDKAFTRWNGQTYGYYRTSWSKSTPVTAIK